MSWARSSEDFARRPPAETWLRTRVVEPANMRVAERTHAGESERNAAERKPEGFFLQAPPEALDERDGARGRGCGRSASFALLLLFSCSSEGWLEVRGQVLSAADSSPLPGAELHLRFNVGDKTWPPLASKPALRPVLPISTTRIATADSIPEAGCTMVVAARANAECYASATPVYQSQRIRFDDCENLGTVSGDEELVIKLEPEP